MSWALILAAAGFMAALGRFIDDHHTSANSKLKLLVQDLLVRMFLELERIAIPDVPIIVCEFVFATKRRMSLRSITKLAMIYLGTIFCIYFGLFGLNVEQSVRSRARDAILCALIATVAYVAFSLPIGRTAMRHIYRRSRIAQRFLVPSFIAILTFSLPIIPFILFSLSDYVASGRFNSPLPSVETGQSLADRMIGALGVVILVGTILEPTVIILVMSAALGVLLTLVLIARLILLTMMDRASDPKKSPFTYLFSFLALLVLFAKIVQEAF